MTSLLSWAMMGTQGNPCDMTSTRSEQESIGDTIGEIRRVPLKMV
jgi:hypothetical protein